MSKTARALAAAAVAAVLCTAAAPLARSGHSDSHSAPSRTADGIGWDIATPATGTPSAPASPADGIGWD